MGIAVSIDREVSLEVRWIDAALRDDLGAVTKAVERDDDRFLLWIMGAPPERPRDPFVAFLTRQSPRYDRIFAGEPAARCDPGPQIARREWLPRRASP